MFLEKLGQIFKIKELREKIFYTLAMLVVFRIAAHIPIPSVNVENLKDFFATSQIFGLLNIFTGGAMDNFSVVALGVGPYITASIIMQLLTMVIPRLEKLAKEEGEEGRRKINQITRILTVPLSALQSYGMLTLLQRSGTKIITDVATFDIITTIITVTGGTVFLMWLGELITENGIGNGISLIIFAGIISRIPQALQQTLVNFDSSKLIEVITFLAIAVLVIGGIVFITEGQRNVPVSYARRVRGMKMYGGMSTHLPLRVNQAGVIPIIFALSVILFPGMIANFFVNVKNEMVSKIAQQTVSLFQNQVFYGILYFVLVVLFTYFYTAVIFDPKAISENIQKQGGFIPGIRPGPPTADYLHRTINRITLTGALFLGVVAVLPVVLRSVMDMPSLVIGGTSILIVVSVVIETVKQVQSQLVMRDYESFY